MLFSTCSIENSLYPLFFNSSKACLVVEKYFQLTVSVAPKAVLSISLRGGCAVYPLINIPSIKKASAVLKRNKTLSAKYHSLHSDFRIFLNNLSKDPAQGISLGNNLYKIRLAISSKRRGKSGGARIITYYK